MRAGVTWLEAQQHASTSCSAWPLVATRHTCGLRPRNSRRATRPQALPHDTSTQHGRRLRSPPTIRAVAAEVETAEAELLTTEGLGDQSDAGQLALLNLAATCSQLEQQLDALPALGPQQPSDSITPEDQKRLEESREQHWRAVQDGRQQRKKAKAATRLRKQAKPCKVSQEDWDSHVMLGNSIQNGVVQNPELITKWQADEAEFSATPPLRARSAKGAATLRSAKGAATLRSAKGAATLQPAKPVPTVVAPWTEPEEGTEEAESTSPAAAAAAAAGAAPRALAPVAAMQRLRPGLLQPVADPESVVIKSQRANTRRSPTGTRRTRAGATRAGATAEVQAPAAAAPAHAARGERVTSRHRTDTSEEETPAAMLQQSLDAEAEGDDLDAVASKGLMGNISRSKQASLLSAKDEVALAKQISKIKPYLLKRDEMTEEQGQQPTLSEWATACGFEDVEAFQSRVAIGEEARQTMIWANQRLVISMARKFIGRGMDMPDLIAEGMTGLAKGVDRFDHTKGFKFSTYAHWWIRQAISRSLSEQGRMIRLPVHVYEQMLKINKARKQFIDDNDRMPTNEELSKASGIGMDRLELVVKAHNDPMHLDAPSAFGGDDGDGSTIGDYIKDPAPSPFQMLLNKSLEKDLDNLLLTLTPREAAVVRMRYGMDDGKEKTLEDVGQALGVTRERIRQIEGKAIRKLRDPHRSSMLGDYDGYADSEDPLSGLPSIIGPR